MRTIICCLTLLLMVSAVEGATSLPDHDKPLSDADIQQLGGIVVGNEFFLGDQVFPLDQLRMAGLKRNLWPNGVLIYEFSPNVTDYQRSRFVAACTAWTQATPVICEARSGQPDYVWVETRTPGDTLCPGSASCATVGKAKRRQRYAINPNHWVLDWLLQHELGHAFGMIHEHQRPDRDSFVSIENNNVESGREGDFILASDGVPYTDYDYVSIMHYDNCQASRHVGCTPSTPNLQTMIPWPCHIDVVGGYSITALDIEGMRKAYAPTIQALFSLHRDQSCSVLDLHPTQKTQVCSTDCGSVGTLSHSKVQTARDSQCGFAVSSKPDSYYNDKYCVPLEKELARYRWTSHALECLSNGIPATFHKLEVKCGCPHQTINAQCTAYSGPVDVVKLEKLIVEGSPKDKRIGRFIRLLSGWEKTNQADKAILSRVGEVVLRNYNLPSGAESIETLKCELQVYVALKKLRNPRYVLSYGEFKKFADRILPDTKAL